MTAPDRITAITSSVTLSLADLARAIGVSGQVLSQWRKGKRTPHPDNLRALADWYVTHAGSVMDAAEDLRDLAVLLEDPERREKVVVHRPRPDTAASKGTPQPRKTAPPQLRQRRGCVTVAARALKRLARLGR